MSVRLLMIFTLFIVSCESNNSKSCSEGGSLTFTTFNIQFLSGTVDSGEVPRSLEDYVAINTLLESTDADLITLQEIGALSALELITEDSSKSWGYEIAISGGSQHVAMLYNTEKIVAVDNVHELTVSDGLTLDYWSGVRYPLYAELTTKWGTEITVIALHLKAGIDESGVLQRANQVNDIVEFISGLGERNIIIAGDLNETFDGISEFGDTLQLLEDDNSGGQFLTSEISEQYTSLEFQDLIDHIWVSDSMYEFYSTDTVHVLPFDTDAEFDNFIISDHRPVVAVFDFPSTCK
ncbi:MAG: endonuclease/exonuclease/phosphatase family protein [Deltaproteobacteria bacterium]|nr:endonuclease/exonuclease/phosphatase family protein [Deltaproteobacteria bacterium]